MLKNARIMKSKEFEMTQNSGKQSNHIDLEISRGGKPSPTTVKATQNVPVLEVLIGGFKGTRWKSL